MACVIRFVRLLVADGEVASALALVLSWVGAQGVAMLGLICALIVLDAMGYWRGADVRRKEDRGRNTEE